MFSFLHVADIHLDSPLHGLSRYEGAPVEEIRGATRQALENLVEYVLQNEIPLVVLAGDVYDADCPDFQTLLHFARQMSRLGKHGVQVVMIRGNHDADNPMTSALRLPDNVTVLPAAKPGTWRSATLPVAVHGQSYAQREVLENLAASYPRPEPDLFNIGLLHTALAGRPGHAQYAPCSLTDLVAAGYQYWALGHMHDYEEICREPHVVYSGCIQGRHVREPGAKGCVRVDVRDDGTVHTEHVVLDVLRWVDLRVDLSQAASMDDLRIAVIEALEHELTVHEARLAAVRLHLHGRCALHGHIVRNPEQVVAQIRLSAMDVSRQRVWVEKVLLDTAPALDLAEIAGGDTPQAALLSTLQAMEADAASLKDFTPKLREVQAKVGPCNITLPDLDDLHVRTDLIREVQNLLIPLLIQETAHPETKSADDRHAH